MPCKNIVKIYIKDGYYHVYNRGTDRRAIFLDEQDYKVFLYFLKILLSEFHQGSTPLGVEPLKKSFYGEVALLAYCLMPNHFHLFLQQKTPEGMTEFMRNLSSRYVSYFNEKYKREGHLFQGSYKAALVDKDSYFLHLSRYIHLNPSELQGVNFREWPYSSYLDYLGKRKTSWLQLNQILSLFPRSVSLSQTDLFSYQSFVEDSAENTQGDLEPYMLD
jgi:putative transposase